MPQSTSKKEALTVDSLVAAMEQKRANVRNMLNKCLFVRTSDLLSNVTSAAKTVEGKFIWVTLDKKYHSVLVKTALAIASQSDLTFPVGLLKEELFSHLLMILNRTPQSDFFSLQKIETKANRANRKRKRLARKRSRAAARERKRECDKLKIPSNKQDVPSNGQTRSCKKCLKKFTSRKRLSKHACTGSVSDAGKGGKEQVVTTDTVKVSEAKRLRRAKARRTRRQTAKAAKVAAKSEAVRAITAQSDENSVAVANNELTGTSSVTGESRIMGINTCGSWWTVDLDEVCEVCEEPAVAAKNGRYLKCVTHSQPWHDYFEHVPPSHLPGIKKRHFGDQNYLN
ncbi:hypothetical protein K440DRAFT_643319 [Wilcoxina mikolae CBS 423.85]|nr:hypothetical protein K440DRAFT_643319 [Wilcoxina mikolae CBS 423.85]